MKKYITTLAVMAFAIAGCTDATELTGDTEGKDAKPPASGEDINKAEDNGGAGNADDTDPNPPPKK